MPRFFVLILFLVPVTFVSLKGQIVDGVKIVRPELRIVSDEQGNYFALSRFVIADSWYLYWKNPGDAGLPPHIKWELPAKWQVGRTFFPVPERFDYATLLAYGYKIELTLVTELIPPPGFIPTSEKLQFTADTDWLVCQESCIQGDERVSVAFDPLKEDPHDKKLLASAREKMPGESASSGFSMVRASIERVGGDRLIVLELKPTFGQPVLKDFYPEPIDGGVIDHQSITIDGTIIRFRVTPTTEKTVIGSVQGLLIQDNGVFLLSKELTIK